MKSACIFLLVLILSYSATALADVPESSKPKARSFKEIEEEIDKLKSSIGVIEQEYHVLIRHTILGFNNANYLRGSLSLIFPRSRSFPSRTDTGLGILFGYGHYFGKKHVLEGTLDWDVYFSGTLRYRYEIQGRLNSFVLAPVLGTKIKLASLQPFDNFIENPNDVKSLFPFVGGLIAFPLNRSLATFEIDYLFNTQAFITAHLGISFFL